MNNRAAAAAAGSQTETREAAAAAASAVGGDLSTPPASKIHIYTVHYAKRHKKGFSAVLYIGKVGRK